MIFDLIIKGCVAIFILVITIGFLFNVGLVLFDDIKSKIRKRREK